MNASELERLNSIHQALQREKPRNPLISSAQLFWKAQRIIMSHDAYKHIVPPRYLQFGQEVAEIMDLEPLEHALVSNSFAIRIGVQRLGEISDQFLPFKFFDLIGFGSTQFGSEFNRRDTTRYIQAQEAQSYQAVVDRINGMQDQLGINPEDNLTWVNAAFRVGRSMGTILYSDDFDAHATLSRIPILRAEIVTQRTPNHEQLSDPHLFEGL